MPRDAGAPFSSRFEVCILSGSTADIGTPGPDSSCWEAEAEALWAPEQTLSQNSKIKRAAQGLGGGLGESCSPPCPPQTSAHGRLYLSWAGRCTAAVRHFEGG